MSPLSLVNPLYPRPPTRCLGCGVFSSSRQEDTSVFCDVPVAEASQPAISLQVDTLVWRCVD